MGEVKQRVMGDEVGACATLGRVVRSVAQRL
jgi:hypothetical protein